MNFLAHLYLAGNEEELILGNFIADSVKGSRYKDYPERVAQGIMMHRAIDFFADTHPVYLRTAHRFSGKHGKFSGVITDMLYDHLLAYNWSDFSDMPLEQFSKKMYTILLKYQNDMPEKSKIILHYMSKYDWLLSYSKTSGLERALRGLSERMKYYHPMNEAVQDIEEHRSAYTTDFRKFFPLILEYVQAFKR